MAKTSETPSSELAKYTKEINKSLKDDCKREKGRDTIDKIAQEILACRQVVSRYESVERYSVMNDPPCNCLKGSQSSVPEQSTNRHEEVG
ncbi:2528_t:CDS:2, partial [Funneliformis geosporum]